MESLKSEDIDQIGLRSVNAELYQRFRVRCAEKKIHYGTGFEQAIVVWLRNLSFTDPYPSREPGKPGRPRKDSTKWKVK
jgi:hypothetical protein